MVLSYIVLYCIERCLLFSLSSLINGVDNITETLVCIMQYNSTALQAAASEMKMAIKLNQHLPETD